MYRKKSREPRQISLENADGTAIEQPTAPNASPERQVLSQLEGAALLQAVRTLPEEYRRVVAMADLQGMAYQEIAEDLAIPVGTVRSRLSRGRERVRRSLIAWHPETAPSLTRRTALG
jgi:RNA polymerase sigma-70 factor (ECF subfamily)